MYFRIMTQGPGSGNFAGMSSETVETLTARAYSTSLGPVSMDGNLTITLPATVSEDN